jgi:desert hedgehog
MPNHSHVKHAALGRERSTRTCLPQVNSAERCHEAREFGIPAAMVSDIANVRRTHLLVLVLGLCASASAAAAASGFPTISAPARPGATVSASATGGGNAAAAPSTNATTAAPAGGAAGASANAPKNESRSSAFPAGKPCDPPSNVDESLRCFRSCSAVTLACTNKDCCMHGGADDDSFGMCYRGCCAMFTAVSSDPIYTESGVCNSGNGTSNSTPSALPDHTPAGGATAAANASTNATGPTFAVPAGQSCTTPGSFGDYQNCVKSCSPITMVCTAKNCCVHGSADSVSFCYRGCCGLVTPGATDAIFTASGVCSSGNGTANSTRAASPHPVPNEASTPNSSIPTNGASTAPGSCFPAHALVTLASGEPRRMDALAVGDRVLVAHKRFSDVFMFTHRQSAVRARFLTIHTASGHKIPATPGHYLYVNGALVPAASVKTGDHMTLESGATSAVVSVSQSVERGIYNPQTLHGDIVVNGVVASTYTTAVSPVIGHAWLAPLRALYTVFGLTSGALEEGADSALAVVPGGSSVY